MKNDTASTVGSPDGTLVLAILGAVELALALVAARVMGHQETYPYFLLAYLAMGAPWLAACHVTHRRGIRHGPGLGVILGVAVVMRLAFLVAEPTLSDDVFRYVWDGRVQHAGINPYRFAPDAPELAELREPADETDAIFSGVNNKDIPTIYPPFMQMAFFAVTAISERIVAMKLFFVLSDLATVLVLIAILGSLGLPASRVVAFAWSPLVVVEVAGSGHNDALAVLCMMTALAGILQGRGAASMGALALSGLAKLVGFALSPLFVRHVSPRAILVLPIVTVALSLPYAGASSLAFRGIAQYGARWRGNDGLFHLLYVATGSLTAAKIVVAAALVALVLVLVARGTHPLRGTYVTVSAILVLMTTVHPWYLLWVAPFLAIYSSPAWSYLSLAVVLSYHAAYLSTPGVPWEDAVWVKLLEYVPFFALAAWGAFRGPTTETPGADRAELHSPP